MRYHIDVLGRLHGVWGFFGLLTGSSLFILEFGCWASLATLNHGSRAIDAAVWILSGTGRPPRLASAVPTSMEEDL